MSTGANSEQPPDQVDAFHGKVNSVISGFTERNIEAILCHEDARRRRKSLFYRVVEKIVQFCAKPVFLLIHLVWFTAWILDNAFFRSFDPYPFPFLMLVVSLEAIFLSMLILISQNLSAVESERRHHLDLQMNFLTERETTATLRLLSQIAEKLEIPEEDRAEVLGFSMNTDPSAVLHQIVRAERQHRAQEAAPSPVRSPAGST